MLASSLSVLPLKTILLFCGRCAWLLICGRLAAVRLGCAAMGLCLFLCSWVGWGAGQKSGF